MSIHRAATALVLCAVAVIGAGRRARRRAPYDELLARRRRGWRRTRSQPEAAGALAALATLEEDVDARALEAAVRGGAGPGAHPLVAAHASWLLARLLDQRGETREAAALRASLGLLSHGFVIGPFGEGRASLNTPFPPEKEPAPPDAGRAATRARPTRSAGASATRPCATACCTWTACCVPPIRPSPTS